MSIPVCESSKEKLGMYGSYPLGNNYQVVIKSQFGVNQINYCQLSLLIENQFAWDRSWLYPAVHSHDIQVITRDLGLASVLGDYLDIMLVLGYNYNICIHIYIYD